MTDFPEAKTSNTFKVKSTNGFEHLFTMRDENVKKLIEKIEVVEKVFLKKGWTPLAQRSFGGGYQKKEIEYVEGKNCPECKGRLVKKAKKDGAEFHQCENKKWDFKTNKNTGTCDFTDWLNPTQKEVPERDVNEITDEDMNSMFDEEKPGTTEPK